MPVDREPGDRPLIGFPDPRWAGRRNDPLSMTHYLSPQGLAAGLAGLPLLAATGTFAADRLGPINITAARSAPLPAPAMPETVITRAEIERSQAGSLAELLRGRAGVTLTNLGGAGKPTNVSLWGQSASRTAVFLDGVRIGSVSAGQTYLEHIPLAQIERIEIVRGARSGQWGADAGGGVIQIFTRDGTAEGSRLSGGFGAGSRGQRSFDATVTGRQGAVDYTIGVAHRETDGFDACINDTSSVCYANEPDSDGYLSDSAQGQLGYRFGDGGHVRGHFLASSADVEYDGYTNESAVKQATFGVEAATGRIDFWQLRARLGRHIDYQDNTADGSPVSRFDTRRDILSLAGDFFLGHQTTLTLGADGSRDELSSSTDFTESVRRNRALFGQLNSRLGALDIQLALRRDFNEQFGTANTGSVDLAYALTDTWTVMAGHGTAFTAPSFNLLYYPLVYNWYTGQYDSYSNPDLEPERSRTTRAGLRWQGDALAIETQVFQTDGDNLIRTGLNPVNLDKTRVRGAELVFSYTHDHWQARLDGTYLSTEDLGSGDALVRQPRWSGKLDLDRQLGAFSVGGSVWGQSQSEGGPYAADNEGFVTADLRGSYHFERHWRIEARIENLFDRDHQPVHGYHAAPRGLFVGLRYGR